MTTLTFKELEQAGWHAKAANYDQWVAPITTQATEAMLDAAQVGHSGPRQYECGLALSPARLPF